MPDPPPLTVGPPVAASVVPATPNTGILADAAELPRVKDVVGGLLKPGCVLHYRTREDLYVEHRFELRFSPSAREASGRLRILLYGVDVTVKRPTADTADAEMETLPKGLGIRSVCKIPDTALGESEARAFIEDELRNKGIDVAASPAQGSAARGPVAEAARLARSGVRGVWNWLAPRPLSAAQGRIQICVGAVGPDEDVLGSLPDLSVTCINITVTCPFGMDYEASSGDCVGGFTSSTPILVFITPPGSNLGGLPIGGTKIPVDPGDDGDDDDDDDDPVIADCEDARDGLAREYAERGVWGDWPCTKFNKTHSELIGVGTSSGYHSHHEGFGYINGALPNGITRVEALFNISMVYTSGYRCPERNAAVSTSRNPDGSHHIFGQAVDFYTASGGGKT
ncbi:hypothetical protein [Candidatus Palauibacter sp.]|uniref:hypothetical protein n=1 Tax=Candidatus Palauibacter sp. TaxID=3101350 RepID=UPI003B5B5740